MNVFRKLLILPYTIGGSDKAFVNKTVSDYIETIDINNENIIKITGGPKKFWEPDYSENPPEKKPEYTAPQYNIIISDPTNLIYIELNKDIDKIRAKQRADYKAKVLLKSSVYVSGPSIFSSNANIFYENDEDNKTSPVKLSPYFAQILCNHLIGLYNKKLKKDQIAKQLAKKQAELEKQENEAEAKRQSALNFQTELRKAFDSNTKKL